MIASNEVPPIVPNLYSPFCAISLNVSKGALYFSMARNAIRFPLYVATIIMQNSHQNPTMNLTDAITGEKNPPEENHASNVMA